jgi:hypothetical protein
VSGLAIGTISTSGWPASTLAAPSSAAPPPVAELRVAPEKRGSTPSLNSSRISLGGATVPLAAGVELMSRAWARLRGCEEEGKTGGRGKSGMRAD